jgi:predicted metallopeptidase
VRRFTKSSSKNKRIEWIRAEDIQKQINKLITSLDLHWIEKKRLYCFRSTNSKTNARARVWGLSRIWQMALKQNSGYIIEVISEKFDQLPQSQKDKILLHELAHIPKNFSGALLPHRRRGKGNFYTKLKKMIIAYENSKL